VEDLPGAARSRAFSHEQAVQHAACGDTFSACERPSISLTSCCQARKQAAEEGTTLTALLADGLRLRIGGAAPARRRRQRLPVSIVGGGLQPWIDPASNASLLDAADDDGAAVTSTS